MVVRGGWCKMLVPRYYLYSCIVHVALIFFVVLHVEAKVKSSKHLAAVDGRTPIPACLPSRKMHTQTRQWGIGFVATFYSILFYV